MLDLVAEIMLIYAHAELDFLELLGQLVLLLVFHFLLLLIPELPEVHDSTDRWRRSLSHKHQIQLRLLGKAAGIIKRDDTVLLPVRSDDSHLKVRGKDAIVRFYQPSDTTTLLIIEYFTAWKGHRFNKYTRSELFINLLTNFFEQRRHGHATQLILPRPHCDFLLFSLALAYDRHV